MKQFSILFLSLLFAGLLPAQNVGIGTTTPTEKLHVNGNIRLADDGDIFGVDVIQGFNDIRFFGSPASVDVDMFLSGDGRLGLGTLNLTQQLSILGGLDAHSSLGRRASFFVDPSFGDGEFQTYGPTDKQTSWMGAGFNSGKEGYLSIRDSNGVAQITLFSSATQEGTITADIKNFVMDHPEQPGKEIWYACVEGPEAAAYVRGTATMVNGRAEVIFPEHFRVLATPATMTVILTPRSIESKGLAVISQSAEGIEVGELLQGTGSYSFDWEVKCVRKGFEDYQVVRVARDVQAENAASVK